MSEPHRTRGPKKDIGCMTGWRRVEGDENAEIAFEVDTNETEDRGSAKTISINYYVVESLGVGV